MEQVIKVTKVEGGFYGCILIEDRIQTALFFPKEGWTQDQVVRRLSRYMTKDEK